MVTGGGFVSSPHRKIEPDWGFLVRQVFEQEIAQGEYEFIFAGNGIEGLEKLKAHPDIGIVLTDLRMPKMDGLTFLSKLQTTGSMQRTVVISAFGDMKNIRQAMNYGAYDFLFKPVDFEDLRITVEKAAKEVRRFRNISTRQVLGFGKPVTLNATVALVRFNVKLAKLPGRIIENLSRQYDELVGILDAYGGTPLRFWDTDALILFQGQGHAVQASRAALETRWRMGAKLRIGISTGMITTGTVGAASKHRFESTAVGGPVRRAYELLERAEEGEILICGTLAEHVQSSCQLIPSLETVGEDSRSDELA